MPPAGVGLGVEIVELVGHKRDKGCCQLNEGVVDACIGGASPSALYVPTPIALGSSPFPLGGFAGFTMISTP